MLVVLDTNVMLQARATGHPYHRLLQEWFAGAFEIAVSTEILLEYEEVITTRAGAARWQTLARVMEVSGQMRLISPSYRFHLIIADTDDDKFADCAIAASADYIITEDRHFEVLRDSIHKPRPITPEEFLRRHLGVI
jgi:uncharacterized protein